MPGSGQSVGFEGIDHFDGVVVNSELSHPVDKTADDNQQVSSKEKTVFDGKDFDQGRDRAASPTDDRRTPQSEDTFERSSRGELAGGLRDGERHRTRRKETGSWADMTEDDQKTDGRQGSRKDDGGSAAQYSRQDRRKSANVTYCSACVCWNCLVSYSGSC